MILPQIQRLTCLAKEKNRVTVGSHPEASRLPSLSWNVTPTLPGLVKGQSGTLRGTGASSVQPLTALLIPILP